MITIIPAIDLRANRCVRLRQGRADDEVVYADQPAVVAAEWQRQGAAYLHIVDLDGAFSGRPVHEEAIRSIAAAVTIPFEVGGGIRSDADVRTVLEWGADRVIIGTRAFERPEDLAALAGRFGARLAVGIDARDGLVQVRGWTETTGMRAVELARKADALGVQTVIYTDTATDGMLQGTNVKAMEEICRAVTCRVIASGGISAETDVLALKQLGCANLQGAIVGKALYERRVSLADLLTAAQ